MNFKSKASIIKQKIMKELIKITDINGRKVVSARELHTFLEVETPPRLWFPRMLEYGFESGIDFEEVQISTPSGQTANDLALTLDTAKEIAMIQRTDKGKEARKYFLECEKVARKEVGFIGVPKSFKEALYLAAQQQEIIEQQQALIAESAPKAEFYDQVTGSKDCIDMAEVAKVCNLGIGRNRLFQFLRDEKILQQSNQPYQSEIDSGHMRMVESKYTKPDGSVCINLKTVVMQKGVDFIIKRWNKRQTH